MIAMQNGIRIVSIAVGIVNVEVQDDGQVLVDRMSYTKHGRMSVRHCMETGEGDQSVLETLKSCLYEMVKDRSAPIVYKMVSDEPIYIEFTPDDNIKGGTHMRVFFAITVDRKKTLLRDYDYPDGNELLGPITMVDANELLKETEGRTVKGHVIATYAAVVALAADSKIFDKIFGRYKRIINGWTYTGPSEEQQAAIDAYPGKW